MTARAQSLDRFSDFMIWPLGMVYISPSDVRSFVTRRVTSSTVPMASLLEPSVSCTRSPNPYCLSVMMKNPLSRSCTTRWAPKPSAAPSTAAGATRELTGIARMSVTWTVTITASRAIAR